MKRLKQGIVYRTVQTKLMRFNMDSTESIRILVILHIGLITSQILITSSKHMASLI